MSISVKLEEYGNDLFTIKTSGEGSNIITDADKRKFGLSDEILKEAVKNYFGRRPTDVYLCSPTPWGDLYSTYNLEQTRVIRKVMNARVMNVRNESKVIKTETFENRNPVISTEHNTFIEREESNSASSSWKNGTSLSADVAIGFDIKILNGKTALSYSRNWGSTKTISKSETLKSGLSSKITLAPGQSTTIEWKVSKKFVQVEVNYMCYLEGAVGINFYPKHEGHHFYFPEIKYILQAGGIKNSVIVQEFIDIELFAGISSIARPAK